MLKIIPLIACIGFLLIAPIKYAADYLETGRTSLISCFMAVLLSYCLSVALENTNYSEMSMILILVMTIPLVFMIVLDTNYKKGFIISLLHGLVVSLIILLFTNMLPDLAI